MSNVAFYSLDMRWGGARSGVRIHDGLSSREADTPVAGSTP